MALDRTWYNTLIDDNGDGLSGSVWDKADVNSLMNAIDAEIARLGARVSSRVRWTPTVQNAAGSTITPSVATCDYTVIGDQLFYRIYVVVTNPGSTPHMRVFTPAGIPPALPGGVDETQCRIYPPTAVSEIGYVIAQNTGVLQVYRASDAAFAAGSHYIIGQGFYFIR